MKTEKQAWLEVAEYFSDSLHANSLIGLCGCVLRKLDTGEISEYVFLSMETKIRLFDRYPHEDGIRYFFPLGAIGNPLRIIAACLCAAMCETKGKQ